MFYKDCKNIDADIPLFFWISVAWRLSVQQKQGFSFGQELNDRLRSLLYRYLLCKENKEDIANLVKEISNGSLQGFLPDKRWIYSLQV